MAIKYNSLKCPECGATLSIESGLATFFCTYCGTKIIATNENEYTYRIVDEAKVKQAETERIVRMKELELEEREKYNTKKKNIIAYVIAFLFVVVGIGFLIIEQIAGVICCLIALGIVLSVSLSNDQERIKKEDDKKAKQGYIEITDYIAHYKNKNYRVIEEGLRTLGFKNIKTLNLEDLASNSKVKRGTVKDVMIDGEYLDCGFYEPNAKIIISYHDYE